MSEQEKQENQKTIVAFAAGLLIGGLLVWVFGGSTPKTETPEGENATTTEEVDTTSDNGTTSTDSSTMEGDEESAPVMQTGEGSVDISNQPSGTTVKLESATFPSDEGWIGVRDYVNGQLGGILGVARFSKEQGLIPKEIALQRATKSGSTYAIVYFSENGDRVFNLANDMQKEGIVGTFTAVEK